MRRASWVTPVAFLATVVVGWVIASQLDSHQVRPPHTVWRWLVWFLPLIGFYVMLRLSLGRLARRA